MTCKIYVQCRYLNFIVNKRYKDTNKTSINSWKCRFIVLESVVWSSCEVFVTLYWLESIFMTKSNLISWSLKVTLRQSMHFMLLSATTENTVLCCGMYIFFIVRHIPTHTNQKWLAFSKIKTIFELKRILNPTSWPC